MITWKPKPFEQWLLLYKDRRHSSRVVTPPKEGSENLLCAAVAGTNLNVMPNGVLGGQSGPIGKVNVAVSGDVLYIENRTGGGIDLHATCT